MTIPGFDGPRHSRLVVEKKRERKGLSYFSHRTKPVSRERTHVLQDDKGKKTRGATRAAPLSVAPDADLLCGPVKHLYQLTRGELAACPVAVGIAKTKPRESGERAQRDRNVNAE